MLSFCVIAIAMFLIVLLFILGLNSNTEDSTNSDYNYESSTQEDIAKNLGKRGEEKITELLGNTIQGRQYLINNLILIDSKGQTTQIDHIYINCNAVFVIETKNLSGRIYGNENQKQWTQVLACGEEKYKFYNPVKQNERHIYKLKKITGTKLPIKSIIVFAQDNTDYINSIDVYTRKQMIYKINAYPENNITVQEMEQFYNQLLALQANQITDEEHIDNIQKAQNDKGLGTCPYCGNKLVERNSEYGTFYGCNGFPNCTYKTNRL